MVSGKKIHLPSLFLQKTIYRPVYWCTGRYLEHWFISYPSTSFGYWLWVHIKCMSRGICYLYWPNWVRFEFSTSFPWILRVRDAKRGIIYCYYLFHTSLKENFQKEQSKSLNNIYLNIKQNSTNGERCGKDWMLQELHWSTTALSTTGWWDLRGGGGV